MLKYVGIRLLQAIPVLFFIMLATFLLIHIIPGNPARLELGERAPATQVQALSRQLGLNRPLIAQFWTFVSGAVQLHFGESLSLHQSVGSVIRSKAGVTVLLMLYSLVISLLLMIPLGVIAAVKRDSAIDHTIRIVGMTFYVMPPFWLGLLLALVFGLVLGVLPTGGYESGFVGSIRSLTLPALALGLVMAPLFLRSLRASVIQTLDKGFVEAARARGFSERRVLFGHVLRNASISTVTLVGLTVGTLIGWTIVVENVFALSGLGPLLVAAVSVRDYPLIQGLAVVMACGVVLINLITDLAYAAIDPRVRL